MKPYKESTPKNTVIRIQKILQDINQLVYPTVWGNPYNEIFSTRVEAIENDGGFGTNGKGRNQEFCLASAYAEYIERVQNLMFIGSNGINEPMLLKSFKETGVFYYPDEKNINKEDFKKLPPIILDDFFPIEKNVQIKMVDEVYKTLESSSRNELIGIPFFNVKEKKITYIPYSFLYTITGSNGMASGNTLPEATFQAFCEIYERYASSLVYYENLVPPTITDDYLQKYPQEYSIIQEIKKSGFEVIVKDFSCGKNLPVLGLIIIDHKNEKYRLNTGCDTNFQVALSRVLTEIFQGVRDLDSFQQFLIPFPSIASTPYFYDENSENAKGEKEKNLKFFFRNGTGIFPQTLFEKNHSYSFDPNNTFITKSSYEEEVKYLINLAQKNNMEVFIRDVSFLGFPSVYIYIPKISIIGKKDFTYRDEKAYERLVVFSELENLLYPFEEFINNEEKIKKFVDHLEQLELSKVKEFKAKDLFRLNFKKNSKWSNLPLNFFLVLINSICGNYSKAYENMNEFVSDYQQQNHPYYQNVLKYLEGKIKNSSESFTISSQVIEDFSTAENLFKAIHYPLCPNCDKCALTEQCLTKVIIEKFNIIKIKSKETLINQNKFASYI